MSEMKRVRKRPGKTVLGVYPKSSNQSENERAERWTLDEPDHKHEVIEKAHPSEDREYSNNVPNEKLKKKFEDSNSDNVKKKSVSDKYVPEDESKEEDQQHFIVNIKVDLISPVLLAIALCTRLYKLSTPNYVVFDELHYGKYVSLYMKHTFFFDQHPPLGKQLIAGMAHLAGYDGNFSFPRIGTQYSENVPIFWLRLIPALCGSMLSPAVYKLLLEAGLNRWTALLGGVLVIFDNALLTQSRLVLMESMLLLFSTISLLFLLRFQKSSFGSLKWLFYGLLTAAFLTFALSVKYVGFYTFFLACFIMCRYLWNLLLNKRVSDLQIIVQTGVRWILFTIIPLCIYMAIFYIHLTTLYKAGPHDSVMTSAFQASLDGGLASITKGQPLSVVHGSQITLRHTFGRTCWLHSHDYQYPLRYPDKRGSSYQQQVTCYSFKDVNNWWIVKRPDSENLVVEETPTPIKDGDVVQLVHGITSRALNSHDIAAPMTPQSQEVSCYIDYKVNMPPQMLWRVSIINKDTDGPVWHALRSQVRLIHNTTGNALRFSGRQLPDWGFHQHEIVADRNHDQEGTTWNVEEHRYTKSEDQKERERQLLNAEMIPTRRTYFTFWDKFIELQSKMLWHVEQLQSHMYSSEPLEWPLLDKGIAYWVDKNSNGQIHLLGNILIWYSGSAAIFLYLMLLVFYVVRRKRLYYDISAIEWTKFQAAGELFVFGYFIHYVPYFFVDRTLFLHNYLPAFMFKLFVLCYIIEHFDYILRKIVQNSFTVYVYRIIVIMWLISVAFIYTKFLALSYGIQKLTSEDIVALQWKDTWDFILHKDLP